MLTKPVSAAGARAGRGAGLAAGVVIVALVWSAVAAIGVFPRALFPTAADIGTAGWKLLVGGDLGPDIAASMTRALLGLGIGAFAGFTVAVATASTAVGRTVLQPVLRLFAPIPTIGLVPLAILWFGLGEESKISVVALGVFVPVWINSHAGLSTTPADFLQAARCLGASRWHTLTRIVIPEAGPDIVAGLRVGAAMAFVLIVVAEMTGTTHGLGYRIYQSQLFSQADRLIFCLIVLGIVGALVDQLLARLTTPVTRWAAQER
ncbi:ABC transporter permease [[Mycobacterium] wendilense]|uniref:ABC transporter permease n=1 Tax=[Mycobacterium] wendilense TaxID=3064284 RepID=A0ABM9MJN3_9MYCO|nr:ABC transporter permease [Mycolicibacterium sp. MU0050]CAJ1586816.1 ABC transporter permease [Mycolicibacterium sp. MU0050]